MKDLRTFGNLGGVALLVLGTAIFMYLEFTDRSDPDYSPPVFVISAIGGLWMAVVGVVVILFSCMTKFLGETACLWLGLCLIALGIAKFYVLDLGFLECWRVSRRVTIPFDLIGVTSLAFGIMLSLKSRPLRKSQADQGDHPSV